MSLKKIINNKRFILVIISLVAIVVGVSLKADYIFEQGKFIRLLLPDRFFGKELSLDDVEIVLSKDKYKIGEEIYYGVQNKTNKTIEVENECPEEPMDIYYLKNERWEHIGSSADVVCGPGEQHVVIAPYELKASSLLPWQNILFKSPGRYKIRLEIVGYKGHSEREFEVME